MKTHKLLLVAATLIISLASCNPNKKADMKSYDKGSFGYDLQFLAEKDSLVILASDDAQAQVIVSAKYQGKVFTSTAEGLEGTSLGYLNYDALNSTEINEHMNGYGGEDRFWLGPEGGKYSVYFAPGTEQVYDNWHTPKPIDIEPWKVVAGNSQGVAMQKEMAVSNYLGNELKLRVDRRVKLISRDEIRFKLGIGLNEGIKAVAYATSNSITNLNDFAWTEETGTVCIWMLDMYHTAPRSLTIIPFNEGSEKELGIIATTDYFGEIPADRFKVKGNVAFLKTDGKYRNKLGMNALRTKAIAGNYDPDTKRLTVTTFDVDPKATYLNQEWNPEKNPLIGDALNAYNDGPLEDGSIMGPFLELESCSPAAFISPDESMGHNHNVYHFVGEEEDLTVITEKLFGTSIEELKKIF